MNDNETQLCKALKELIIQFEDLLNNTDSACDWHNEALKGAYKALRKAEGKQ